MKNDEINRTIKECFKSLDYRDNEIAKLNTSDLTAIDKNIEIFKKINLSLSESIIKLTVLGKKIPENSGMQKYINRLITVLNDSFHENKGAIKILQELKTAK